MKKEAKIEDFDFGFSFADEEIHEVKKTLNAAIRGEQEKIEELEDRLKLLYSSVIPFLDNLCKNPEKSTIHWPNRVEKIQEYKQKLKLIVEGKTR